MKHLFIILLLFIMCFSLAACDAKTESVPPPDHSDTIIILPSGDEVITFPNDEKNFPVIISPSEKKYHLDFDCEHINLPNIGFRSLNEAKKMGYKPCLICCSDYNSKTLKTAD